MYSLERLLLCQILCFFPTDEGDLKDLLPTDLLQHDEDLISMLEDEDLGKTTAGEDAFPIGLFLVHHASRGPKCNCGMNVVMLLMLSRPKLYG